MHYLQKIVNPLPPNSSKISSCSCIVEKQVIGCACGCGNCCQAMLDSVCCVDSTCRSKVTLNGSGNLSARLAAGPSSSFLERKGNKQNTIETRNGWGYMYMYIINLLKVKVDESSGTKPVWNCMWNIFTADMPWEWRKIVKKINEFPVMHSLYIYISHTTPAAFAPGTDLIWWTTTWRLPQTDTPIGISTTSSLTVKLLEKFKY